MEIALPIIMKAMIFAAGLGTRLKPLTDTMPKAMVPVAGKPLLQHVIEKLKRSGFNEIIINVHHFAEQIIDYVRANNSFDIRIEFSDESEKLLDTGGGIKKASWFFNDGKPFLIHNVDIVSNTDLQGFYQQHLSGNASATLVASERETSRYLLFDHNNTLKGWINEKTNEIKSPYENFDTSTFTKLAFSGIHIINPRIFSYFHQFGDAFSIIDFYLSICNTEAIKAYTPENFKTMDVGKIDSLPKVEEFISKMP